MVKVVNGTTVILEEKLPPPKCSRQILVRTIYYDNGVVVEQFGRGNDWVQIKNADLETQEVGKCRDCGEMIYEHDEYEFSKQHGNQWHGIEDDCLSKCGVCDQPIRKGQLKFTDKAGNYRHHLSEDCGS